MQMQVKVGQDFFTKGLRDYANWRWAWVRELVQNGVDAGSKTIKFTVVDNGDNTCTATCENDGPPMDKDVLFNKFLSLGGSTKDGNDGSIGGFGAAKICICLAHKSYSLHTGTIIVRGAGGEFEVLEAEYFPGVKTVVHINATAESINREIRRFLKYTQGRADLKVFHNGVDTPLPLYKYRARRELSFGTVHVNKSYNSLVVVRVNGIPMFYDETLTDKCVILELNKSSLETLTANRDGLQYKYQADFNKFLRELTVNKRSALKPDTVKIRHFEGMKFYVWNQASKEDRVESSSVPTVVKTEPVIAVGPDGEADPISPFVDREAERKAGVAAVVDEMYAEAKTALAPRKSAVKEDFFVRDELGLKIPAHYLPASRFSSYSKKLVKKWGYYLLRLHQLFDKSGHFSIGFVFSDEAEALYEQSGTRGVVYYINPAKVVRQASSSSRSFRNSFSAKDDDRLLMIALHEFIHGAGARLSWHDDEFASRLTDMAAVVMKNRKFFNEKVYRR
jgi:hypothetical protein